MNHSCLVDIGDYARFAAYFLNGWDDPDCDLNHDGVCDFVDLGVLYDGYGQMVPGCEPCGVVADSCGGLVRIDFSLYAPWEGIDRIDLPVGGTWTGHVIAEGCIDGIVTVTSVETSPNILITSTTESAGWALDGSGEPQEIFSFEFELLDEEPGWIRPADGEGPGWELAWAQRPYGRKMLYETVQLGGVNADPPPDTTGCSSQPSEPVCGDGEWGEDPCEFCGQDAYAITGSPEMNHNCFVHLEDLALFAQDYQAVGEGLSGDFDGSGHVTPIDLAILALGYNQSVPDCTPCGVVADSCAGTIRVTFAEDLSDLDRIDLPPQEYRAAWIVAEDCVGMGATLLGVYATPNVVRGSLEFPTPVTIGDCHVAVYPPSEGETLWLASFAFYVTDSEPAMIGVTGSEGFGPLQWIQLPQVRRMGFETIAYGGINGDPPPDATGCLTSAVPTEFARRNDLIRIATIPNPAAQQVSISLSVPRPTEGEVILCDVAGRIVNRLYRGEIAPGMRPLQWDGRTEAGSFAPAGIYFVRLRGSRVEPSSRIIWLR